MVILYSCSLSRVPYSDSHRLSLSHLSYSNLICSDLDNSLTSYCNKHKITYSRYADDLTFSANAKHKLIIIRFL